MADIEIIHGKDDAAIAQWLHGRLASALAATPGEVEIAVPGGSTPFPIMERLVALPLDWRRITVWPGDDRVVPEAHPASNAGRIGALLEPVGAKVRALSEDMVPPHFVLVWLGMGADGHIASLFPSADPRADDPRNVRRLTPDPLPPEAPYDRLTLTIPALLDSDEVVFVIRGEEKCRLFHSAMAGQSDLPVARLLRAAHQPVTCFT